MSLLAGCGGSAATQGPTTGSVAGSSAVVGSTPVAGTTTVLGSSPITSPSPATDEAAAAASAPSVQPSAVANTLQSLPLPPHVVTVAPGDTLWGIARAHGLPLSVVLDANPQIADPALIHPGEQILLPAAVVLADAELTPAAGTEPIGRVTATIVMPVAWG